MDNSLNRFGTGNGEVWDPWSEPEAETSDGGTETLRVDPEVTFRIRPLNTEVEGANAHAGSEASDDTISEHSSADEGEDRKSADEELMGAVGGWNPFRDQHSAEEGKGEYNPWSLKWGNIGENDVKPIKSASPSGPTSTPKSKGPKREGKVKKPVVMPAKYDGSADLDEYLAHFDLCIVVNGWTRQQAGAFLGISLQGVARRLLAGLDPATESGYRKLRRALEQRFAPRNQTESFKALLRTRKRKAGETLQTLAEEIWRLVRLAYPGADASTLDSMGRDRFLESLGDIELRHWIYQSKPKTLEEAITTGVEAEAYLQVERKAGEKVRASGHTMAEEMQSLTEKIQKLVDGQNRLENKVYNAPKKTQPSGACYQCGEKGHFRRSCPKLKDSEDKATGSSQPEN